MKTVYDELPYEQLSKMIDVATEAYCKELDVDRRGGIMENVVSRGMGPAIKAVLEIAEVPASAWTLDAHEAFEWALGAAERYCEDPRMPDDVRARFKRHIEVFRLLVNEPGEIKSN